MGEKEQATYLLLSLVVSNTDVEPVHRARWVDQEPVSPGSVVTLTAMNDRFDDCESTGHLVRRFERHPTVFPGCFLCPPDKLTFAPAPSVIRTPAVVVAASAQGRGR